MTKYIEVLELIECVGNRKWGVTDDGKSAIHEWSMISADVANLTLAEEEEISIMPPPMEIAELLSALEMIHHFMKKETHIIFGVRVRIKLKN